MVLFASQVQQQIYQSQLAMAAQSQNAQMLSAQMGLMPHMGAVGAMQTGQTGIYGEQVANRMVNGGRTAAGVAGLGIGVAGMMTGLPLDPFSAVWSAGKAGMAMGGWQGALGFGAAAALPFMAVNTAAEVYGGAFRSGMTQQAGFNSTLRNNFNFAGGQGAFGRGFSQQQMGQIGSTITQEMARTPFASAPEMNALIGQGAEMGMFTAVKDVQQFTQRFRSMIDGLRKIQKELGGSLSEALSFTRGAQQVGIYSTAGRTAFASEMRDTMASTGMGQEQLFSLAATGSMLSRATGGVGRQGALGALRTARTIGTALSSGAINMESLSEATGGLQGEEAIQAFTARTMQMSDRFSRSARGRYSLFALSNANGTGLDQDMLDRYRAGDITPGEVMRGANTRVNRMGRAKAINNEGRLRGAMMEEGGLSAKLQDIRMMIGEKAFDGGDDLAQLVLQRRGGYSQPESQLIASLMRNRGQIAATETVDRSMAKGQVERQQQAAARGLDSFMANLEHGVQEGTGVLAAKQLGANFLTKISALAEKTMNEFLGIQTSALTGADRSAMTRVSMGMGTNADRQRMLSIGASATGTSGGMSDPFARSLSSQGLSAISRMSGGIFHFETPQSMGEIMRGRGVEFGGMGERQRQAAINAAYAAQAGSVSGVADSTSLNALLGDAAGTRRQLLRGAIRGKEGFYGAFGGASANAVDAASARMGYEVGGLNPDAAAGDVGGGPGILSKTMAGARRGWNAGSGGLNPFFSVGGALAGTYAGLAGGVYDEVYTSKDKAAGYLARGGHVGDFGRAAGKALSGGGFSPAAVAAATKKAATMGTTLADALAIGRADISKESVMSVAMSDAFQQGIRALSNKKITPEQKAEEIDKLQKAALAMSGKEREAAGVLIENLRVAKGGPGTEFLAFVQDKDKFDEMKREWSKIGGGFDTVIKALPNTEFGETLGKIAGGYASMAAGKGGQEGMMASTDALVAQIASADPNSSDMRKLSGALSKIDAGRGILMQGRQMRAVGNEMMGKGRRGWKGAADAIFGQVTGNTLGEMDLELNGKVLNKRDQAQTLYREFTRGGKNADALAGQLVDQLKSNHVEGAEGYVQDLQTKLYKNGMDRGEANEMIAKLGKDDKLNEMRMKGIEAMQKANDPLGVARNQLLEKIATGVNKMAGIKDEKTPTGLPMSGGE
jgi:hypothetical protein